MTETPPSPFSNGNPHLRFAWDATSLDCFLRDPLAYYWQYVLGYQSTEPKPPLTFGKVVHSALEQWDKARLAGKSKNEALYAALDHGLELAKEPEPDLFPGWTLDDIAANGKRLDAKKRGSRSMVRLLVWYAEEYEDDDYEVVLLPSGEPAVEVSFAWPLGIKTPYGEDYLVCGHLDGLARHRREGHVVVRERKHTVTTLGPWYFQGFKPNTQINTYSVVGQLVLPDQDTQGVLVEAAQCAVEFHRFDREWIRRTVGLNDEWLNVMRYHIKRAEALAESGDWYMAHNPMGAQVYGGGPFREMVIRDPAVREQFLATNYERTTPWNPLDLR